MYKHNIVLGMYCMLLLYNLQILLNPIQHIRISCPFGPLIIGHQGLLHLLTVFLSFPQTGWMDLVQTTFDSGVRG